MKLNDVYNEYVKRYGKMKQEVAGIDVIMNEQQFEQVYGMTEGTESDRVRSVLVMQINTSPAQVEAVKRCLEAHNYKGFEDLKSGNLDEAFRNFGNYGVPDLIAAMRQEYGNQDIEDYLDSPKENRYSSRNLAGIREKFGGINLKDPAPRQELLESIREKQNAEERVKQLEAENAKLLAENEKLRALLEATSKGSGAMDSGSMFNISDTASIAMKISEYIAKSSKVPTAEDVERMVEMFALGRRS